MFGGGTLNSRSFLRREVRINIKQHKARVRHIREESPCERTARRKHVTKQRHVPTRETPQVVATPRPKSMGADIIPETPSAPEHRVSGFDIIPETPNTPEHRVSSFEETTGDHIEGRIDAVESKITAMECGINAILTELRCLSRRLELDRDGQK